MFKPGQAHIDCLVLLIMVFELYMGLFNSFSDTGEAVVHHLLESVYFCIEPIDVSPFRVNYEFDTTKFPSEDPAKVAAVKAQVLANLTKKYSSKTTGKTLQVAYVLKGALVVPEVEE